MCEKNVENSKVLLKNQYGISILLPCLFRMMPTFIKDSEISGRK